MPHIVEFLRSFEDNFSRFVPPAETEMGDIVRALEGKRDFIPDARDYDFERDANTYCVCSHKRDWGSWQMYWYEEMGFQEDRVTICVGLRERTEPVVTTTLRPAGKISPDLQLPIR
jgi:hypothetical protein